LARINLASSCWVGAGGGFGLKGGEVGVDVDAQHPLGQIAESDRCRRLVRPGHDASFTHFRVDARRSFFQFTLRLTVFARDLFAPPRLLRKSRVSRSPLTPQHIANAHLIFARVRARDRAAARLSEPRKSPCYDACMRGDHFWRLEHRSNTELLTQLQTILSSGRRLTAELVAHLGEVEERRLHLEAACSSMFDYCVRRLGLSEDEACRRIEVARLGRRFPALFPLLASGEVSLTVAASLKPHLMMTITSACSRQSATRQ
jgi:hypothetical protein